MGVKTLQIYKFLQKTIEVMKRIFSSNYFRNLAKELGIERISFECASELALIVQEKVSEILKVANEFAKHAKRNTIFREDIRLAIKKLGIKI